MPAKGKDAMGGGDGAGQQSRKRPLRPTDPTQAAIGKRLKGYYDEVATEPVPDRFLELLKELESAPDAKKADSGTEKTSPDEANDDKPEKGAS